MPQKIFLVNPNVGESTKETIQKIANEQIAVSANAWEDRERKAAKAMQEECNLKHVDGRVIIKVNVEGKNSHRFENGLVIRRERKFNEFNRRITEPTNAIVVSAEHIPSGSEILIAHNSLHDTNKIFDYKTNSNDVFYFSIPEADCFAWRTDGKEFQPMRNFEFGLRVFERYKGIIEGVPPTIIKDVLFITTGEFTGLVAHTVKASDYQIVFQGDDGKEANLIRIRHSQDETFERQEIICISMALTEKVQDGKLLVGLTANDAKKLLEL